MHMVSAGAGTPSTLQADLATGTMLTTSVGDGLPPARILKIAKIDGTGRADVFVDAAHISTDDTVAIYVDRGNRLIVAGRLPAFGGDSGIRFGFNCTRVGVRHAIVSHSFQLRPESWFRSDTLYLWRAGRLQRHGSTRTVALTGPPPRSQTGVGC